MKTFSRQIWTTCDGCEHTSVDSALKYVEEQYGERVLRLSKRITATNGHYTKVVDMVDANMPLLREIVIWNDDKRLVEELEGNDE